jgi:uncharacterized OB-fold protein
MRQDADKRKIMTKKCSKCGNILPLSSFSKDIRLKSPYRASCKQCDKAMDKKYKETPEGRSAHNRAKKKYVLNNPNYYQRHCGEWQRKNPEKVNAHQLLNQAVSSGRIIKQPCAKCGELKVVAHHFDYTKPLEVIWLCYFHHSELHKQKGGEDLLGCG